MENTSLTRVEYIDGYYFKRDDEYECYGAYGGKARVAISLIENGIKKGYKSFTTTGSRDSRQCEIVSKICESLGVECNIFMPSGKDTDVIQFIQKLDKTIIHRTKVGYNSVLVSESLKWSKVNNSFYIPFGMECVDAVDVNLHQVANIPNDVKRIIIPCGGGMNMISVIKGLNYYGRNNVKVIGVQVGKDPSKNINNFLGDKDNLFCSWNYEIVKSNLEYSKIPKDTEFCGIDLDPIYEAKCIPFLQKGDLLWIVGKRL